MKPLSRALRATGLLVAGGLAVSLLTSVSSASAAPIGTLTFNSLSTQDSVFTMTTSGACPDPATNFLIKLEGGNIPVPSSAPNLTGNTAGSTVTNFSTSAFTATASKNLSTYALNNGLAALADGTYTVTLVCRTALASASLGDYVGTFVISNSGATVTPQAPASPDATTTTLAPASLTPGWGIDTGFVVTVTDNVDGALKPTGTVALVEGATTLGSAPLLNGTATIPASFDTGDHVVKAVYTSSDTSVYLGSESATSTVSPLVGIPTLLRAPTVTGAVLVGQLVTCNTGTWATATSYRYEFLKNGVVAQDSTTDFDIALTAADLGKTFSCRVTGINPKGPGTSAATTAVVIGKGVAPRATVKPRIVYSGTAIVGRTFTAYAGVWSPAPTSYYYIWKRGTVIVKQGATSAARSYRATLLDKGKVITLTVVANRTGHLSGAAVSAGVKVL